MMGFVRYEIAEDVPDVDPAPYLAAAQRYAAGTFEFEQQGEPTPAPGGSLSNRWKPVGCSPPPSPPCSS